MGIAPEVFWSMTLVEWRAAVAGFAGRRWGRAAAPLDGKDLRALMRRYPDTGA
jgi:uncharacterized phage protein (TIGR02216 family)